MRVAADCGRRKAGTFLCLLSIREERERFEIFDEYPFWSNNEGIINKQRSGIGIFHRESGLMTSLLTENESVSHAAFHEKSRRVAFSGWHFDEIHPYKQGLYVLSLDTGIMENIEADGDYEITDVDFLADEIVYSRNAREKYGVSSAHEICCYHPETKRGRVLLNRDFFLGNGLVTDIRYGSLPSFQTDGEYLYFLSTEDEDAYLCRCSADGVFETVVNQAGSVEAFSVSNGNLALIGLYNMGFPEIYCCSVAEPAPKQLSFFNRNLQRQLDIQPIERADFTDKYGVQIHGYVIRPYGFDPNRKYPAILDIHGGPQGAYSDRIYMHEMQYWASCGYFVFFCNPIGSIGRGEKFAFICGKFGMFDYEDIMAFTDEVLARYPQIDPNRLGVTGGSYGGFMTNWIIGHTNRFAAAASQRSISNMVSMIGVSDVGTIFASGEVMADIEHDPVKLWWHSPIRYAKDARTPTLFIQSERDYRSPYMEAIQMYTALRRNCVDARVCLFKNENHELSRSGSPKNRVKRLEEITDWMDRYLKREEQQT